MFKNGVNTEEISRQDAHGYTKIDEIPGMERQNFPDAIQSAFHLISCALLHASPLKVVLKLNTTANTALPSLTHQVVLLSVMFSDCALAFGFARLFASV